MGHKDLGAVRRFAEWGIMIHLKRNMAPQTKSGLFTCLAVVMFRIATTTTCSKRRRSGVLGVLPPQAPSLPLCYFRPIAVLRGEMTNVRSGSKHCGVHWGFSNACRQIWLYLDDAGQFYPTKCNKSQAPAPASCTKPASVMA